MVFMARTSNQGGCFSHNMCYNRRNNTARSGLGHSLSYDLKGDSVVNLEEIKAVISKVLQTYGMILTNVRWINQAEPILEVSIMNEDYVFDLDMAELVTEPISNALDESNLLDRAYMLDIGSPGAEREIVGEDDLRHQIDEYVFVKLKQPKAGFDQYEGYLREVSSEAIRIEYREKTRVKVAQIDQENIAMIRLAVKF